MILLLFSLPFFGCEEGHYEVELGGGYVFRSQGEFFRDIYCEDTNRTVGVGIPIAVLDYTFNNNFIIARQKPDNMTLNHGPFDYYYKSNGNDVYYWIIVKKERRAIGPLDKEEYIRARFELNIQKSLFLNDSLSPEAQNLLREPFN